ncbi:MAG: GTP-binding protein, partial [Eubacterium sp.]|nr:GTP-binding protein [Eubacterium sp.]
MNQKLHTVIGILAHVDAGKTTLSEGILYKTGVIRKAGRVDHGDAFLDTDTIERQRGITIFSKQAEFSAGGRSFTLLDTPGHVDFSPEMERTLQVLDAAVLVISAPEGINGRVRTLWKLLEHYQVPVILFVNKMDQAGADRSRTLAGLQKHFGGGCIDFQEDLEGEALQEQLAVCDEAVLEAYLEGEPVGPDTIARLVSARKIYPCYFGAALQMEGVDDLLEGLAAYAGAKAASADFDSPAGSAGAGEAASADGFPAGGMAESSDRPSGSTAARVFKISRDAQGTRLTWIRLLKGKLRVKEAIMGSSSPREEKIDQIRIYSGERYELVQTLEEGRIAALTGLTDTFAGQGLGAALDLHEKLLQPVYTSAVIPAEPGEYAAVLQALRILEEEEPLLQVSV